MLDVLLCLLYVIRIGSDRSVSLLVHGFNAIGTDAFLNKLGKLALILLRIFFLQSPHVIRDMKAEDSRSVGLPIVRATLSIVAGKSLVAVRDVETAITSAFERPEDAVPCCSSDKPDVQHCLERPTLIIRGLLYVVLIACS